MNAAQRLLATAGEHNARDFKQIGDIENQFVAWKQTLPTYRFETSVNPRSGIYLLWSSVVSIAVLYNLVAISLLVFEDFRGELYWQWLAGNLFADIVYLSDIFVHARCQFYDEGCKVVDIKLTITNYLRSSIFVWDVVCVLPWDLFLLVRPTWAFLRLNRLLKTKRIIETLDLSLQAVPQTAISLVRISMTCCILFHWNACAFYSLSMKEEARYLSPVLNATFDDDVIWPWPFMPEKITDVYFTDCSRFQEDCLPENILFDENREDHYLNLYDEWKERTVRITFTDLAKEYALSIYWSVLTMTTLGEQPSPNRTNQNVFEVLNTVIGIVLFAAIMVSVGDLVANANKVKVEWQLAMDTMKQYMKYRSLNSDLQRRVLKYCEYEMTRNQRFKEVEVRREVPAKLYYVLNTALQWQTLTKAELFKGVEVPFLRDLSGRLEPADFGPHDVIFQKGDLCRALVVVAHGHLLQVDENGVEIDRFVAGEVIGDRHLFSFDANLHSNRRPNTVCSDGYSEVFILSSDDFFSILHDYPYLRVKLRERALHLQKMNREIDSERGGEGTDDQTVDERLRDLQTVLDMVSTNLDQHYRTFVESSRRLKRKLFQLEITCSNDIEAVRRRMN